GGVAPMIRAGLRREFGSLSARFHVDAGRRDVVDNGVRYGFSRVGGALGFFTSLAYGRVLLEGGVEGGYGFSWQDLPANRRAAAGDVSLSGVALVSMRAGPTRLGLDF